MDIYKGIGKWCWFPRLINNISYKQAGWKLYRWGYWNFSFTYKQG